MSSRTVRALALAATALLAATVLTACGRRRRPPAPPAARRRPCGSATSRTSPTRPRWSASKRASSSRRLGSTKLDDQDVQRRPGRDRGAVLRRDRRHLHRPEPGDQRLGAVQGHRPQDHRGQHLGRRRPGGQARASTARPTSRARRSPPRSSATPRTSRCAPGSSRTGLNDRPAGRRRRRRSLRRTTRRRCRRSRQGAIDGAWVPEPYATRLVSWRPAARCWSTRRTCGRTASSSPPT